MSSEFLALVRQCPCAVDRAYTGDVQSHHLMLKQFRGVGMKAPDRYSIPLSLERHNELHRYGSRRHEAVMCEWGVDGEALAAQLWAIFCFDPATLRLARMRAAVMEHLVT